MAKLNDLLSEISASSKTLKVIVGEDLGHMVSVTVLYKRTETTGGGQLRRWIMVKDRGLGTEDAYWDGSKPEYLADDNTFRTELEAQIAAYQTANPNFEKYQIIDLQEKSLFAIVKGYVLAGGKSKETNFIFLEKDGIWYVREMQ